MADEVNGQQSEQGVAGVPQEASSTDQAVNVPEQNGAEAEAEPAAPAGPEVAFSWQASEYVHHHKSVGWYATLAMAIGVLVAGAVWLQLWLYVVVFLVMGVAVVVYAHKPPRTMMYELSSEGVHVDGKLFPFSEFRSFGVMPDEEWHSIDLEPAKRFNPRMVLLFDPEDFEDIVSHLELHLPRADRQPDIIERVTRYLRF